MKSPAHRAEMDARKARREERSHRRLISLGLIEASSEAEVSEESPSTN